MLTLYGAFRSRATRPLWMLYETGTPFTHVPVLQAYRLADPQAVDAPINTASAAYLAVNPLGQVPTLVDGDLVLTESLAMTCHIARRHGGEFGPLDATEEALVQNWALLAATGIETPALDIAMVWGKGQQESEAGRATIARSTALLHRMIPAVAKALQGQDWLMGGRFTVADVVVSECVRYGAPQPGIYAAWPEVEAWLARLHARPAFQRMWAGRNAEPA